MPASADFNGISQVLYTVNSSVGPHKILAYPFSLFAIVNCDNQGWATSFGLSTSASSRKCNLGSSVNITAEGATGSTSGQVTITESGSNTLNATWNSICFVQRSATDYELYRNAVSKGTQTTSRDIIGSAPDYTSIGARLSSSNPLVFLNGIILFVGYFNRSLSIQEQLELTYNPFIFSRSQVGKWFFLNTISVVGDCKDQSGNSYTFGSGTVPSTSTSGPPIFMDGGAPC